MERYYVCEVFPSGHTQMYDSFDNLDDAVDHAQQLDELPGYTPFTWMEVRDDEDFTVWSSILA